jgi:3-oxo-5-alpha-steroid 4-dehydrogenase 3 / polyprenol reductase
MASSGTAALLAIVEWWLNCLGRLVVPVYLVLSAIAPFALAEPATRSRSSRRRCHNPLLFFGRLASHGKTLHGVANDRISKSSTSNDTTASSTSRSASKRTGVSFVQSGWKIVCDEFFRTDGWFYVPKRYFSHFYLLGMVQLLLCASVRTKGPLSSSSSHLGTVWFLLGSHLARRYGECLCVQKWTPQSRMHVAGYLLGIIHYLLLPLALCPDESDDPLTTSYEKDARSRSRLVGRLACAVLCLYAQYQQHRHHGILAGLRSAPASSNSSSAMYSIPTGGWFRFVSSPHYLAEIVIYASLVVLATLLADKGLSPVLSRRQYLRGCALLLWVIDNLIVSAIATHRWYLRRFPDEYAKLNRKAIVPYLL